MYLKKKDVNNNDELNINIEGYFLRKSHLTIVQIGIRRIVVLSIERKHVANWCFKFYR